MNITQVSARVDGRHVALCLFWREVLVQATGQDFCLGLVLRLIQSGTA